MRPYVVTLGRVVLMIVAFSGLMSSHRPALAEETTLKGYRHLLATYVRDGLVDYKRLGQEGRAELDAFVAWVGKTEADDDRGRMIGLYVDAYNALVLASVLRHGRPRSVLDVDGFFNRERHMVTGRSLTLDELQKNVLAPIAKDPRTHFVLVCGAVGCPILENEPYLGSNIDERFERAARRYLTGPRGATVEVGRLRLSKIFDWYSSDFGGPSGVLAFVVERIPRDRRTTLGPEPKVEFIDYNWTLNQQ